MDELQERIAALQAEIDQLKTEPLMRALDECRAQQVNLRADNNRLRDDYEALCQSYTLRDKECTELRRRLDKNSHDGLYRILTDPAHGALLDQLMASTPEEFDNWLNQFHDEQR